MSKYVIAGVPDEAGIWQLDGAEESVRCDPIDIKTAEELFLRGNWARIGDIVNELPEPETPRWYLSYANLSRLLLWMGEHEMINENFSDIAYFLSKPWKYDGEWINFQAYLENGGK